MKKHTYTLAVLVVFSVLFFSLPLYFENSEGLQNFSSQIRDIFFKIRHLSSDVPDKIHDLVIVTIDEESSGKLGIRWPWPRAVFARMIDELTRRGARTIGLNVAFTGLEGGDEASTQELARAMHDHGNVVIGVTFDKENNLVPPSPLLAEAVAGTGYLEKIVDPDYAIRRSYFLRPYWIQPMPGSLPAPIDPSASDSRFEGSFPLQLLAAHLGSPGNAPRFNREEGTVTLGSPVRRVKLADDGSYAINYLAAQGDFDTVPAWKVVEGKFSETDARGKLVLVGLTSSLFTDMHRTPYG
ncbi:MAG: CHASE2 domain-containing protein, partial [Candidatus Omnitrophota bacterium]